MARLRNKRQKRNRGGGVVATARNVYNRVTGKTEGKGRRRRGPAYWANKVLVEKLKRRYNKLKFGGVR